MHTSSTCMRTSSGLAFDAEKNEEGKRRKEGNAVQPLTELDRFEKSWESAMVACSRIALEHQTRKKRFVRRHVGAPKCDEEVYKTIRRYAERDGKKSGYCQSLSVLSKIISI